MAIKRDEIWWVIRSVNERTLELCIKLLAEISYKNQVYIVNEIPFSKALKKAYESGFSSGLKWTACIDADVLLIDSQIDKFLNVVSEYGQDIFCAQGLIIDKLIPIKRPSGIHLYRSQYLEKAISLIPQEGSSMRPESFVKVKMNEQGFPTLQTNVVVGLHDYGQKYIDIYRKAFLHAHKHDEILSLVEEFWRKNMNLDLDYKVALSGALAGKLNRDPLFISKNYKRELGDRILEFLEIREKGSLQESELNKSIILSIFKQFQIDHRIQLYKNDLYKENYLRDSGYRVSGAKKLIKDVVYRTGLGIYKLGSKLNEY